MRVVHDKAREVLWSGQVYQKRAYDKRVHTTSFGVGDMVYELNSATQDRRSSKLQPVWNDPLLVTEVKSSMLLKIQGLKRACVVHHDRLKLCKDSMVPVWLSRLRRIPQIQLQQWKPPPHNHPMSPWIFLKIFLKMNGWSICRSFSIPHSRR